MFRGVIGRPGDRFSWSFAVIGAMATSTPGWPPVLEAALGALSAYGPAALALVFFAGGLGAPIPGTMLLLAVGAAAQAGLVDARAVVLAALAATVLGDGGSYLIGRYGGRKVVGWLEDRLSWRRAERAFERWGALAILFSRFLVTPLALPTNLMAGGERYGLRRFLPLSALGNLVWVALFGGLGYVFAGSWEAIGALAGDLGLWLAGAVLAAIGVYELFMHVCLLCLRAKVTGADDEAAAQESKGRSS